MEFITDYKTEKYVLQASWDDFPMTVKEHAVMCAIDLIGALILGSRGRQFQVGIRIVE